MSVPVTFNGIVYQIPVKGDINWGPELTRYLVALAAGAISSITGTSNEVIVTPITGGFNLSLPQPIAPTSSPTFAGLTLSQGPPFGITIDPPALAASYTIILPNAQGGVGAVPTNDGSGNLTWVTPTGSGTVNAGTINQIAYYAASGSTLSGSAFATFNPGTNRLILSGNGAGININTGNTSIPVLRLSNTVLAAELNIQPSGDVQLVDDTNGRTFFDYSPGGGGLVTLATPLSLGANKIISLANGTALSDAAAFGQVQYAFQPAVQTVYQAGGIPISSPVYSPTGISATITPTSVLSRIKISVSICALSTASGGSLAKVTLFRNGVNLVSDSFLEYLSSGVNITVPSSFTFIDVPGSTAGQTYDIEAKTSGAVFSIGGGGVISIILEELR